MLIKKRENISKIHDIVLSFLFFIGVENVNNNAGEGDDVPEGEMNPMNGPHHHIHNEYEPILSRASYDLPPPDGADSQKRVRKVAAAPTVPSYKGNGC